MANRLASLQQPSPQLAPTTGSLDAFAGRLGLRLDELVVALGISRRAIERYRAAGSFPRPDRVIGRIPLWRPETIRQWMAEGSGE